MITPQKHIDAYEVTKSIEKSIYGSGLKAGYFPIIETPFLDDPTIRQISPIN